jgi:hypothetical protein
LIYARAGLLLLLKWPSNWKQSYSSGSRKPWREERLVCSLPTATMMFSGRLHEECPRRVRIHYHGGGAHTLVNYQLREGGTLMQPYENKVYTGLAYFHCDTFKMMVFCDFSFCMVQNTSQFCFDLKQMKGYSFYLV